MSSGGHFPEDPRRMHSPRVGIREPHIRNELGGGAYDVPRSARFSAGPGTEFQLHTGKRIAGRSRERMVIDVYIAIIPSGPQIDRVWGANPGLWLKLNEC